MKLEFETLNKEDILELIDLLVKEYDCYYSNQDWDAANKVDSQIETLLSYTLEN